MSPIATHFLRPLHGITFAVQQEYYLLSICFIASMFPRIGSIPNVNRDHVVGIGNTDDTSQPQAAVIKEKQRRQHHIGWKTYLWLFYLQQCLFLVSLFWSSKRPVPSMTVRSLFGRCVSLCLSQQGLLLCWWVFISYGKLLDLSQRITANISWIMMPSLSCLLLE